MKIVSVTVSSHRPDIIRDAILSAKPFVDGCMLVSLDDGTLPPDTWEVFRKAAGDKAIYSKLPIDATTTMGYMRTAALRLADAGFDWAMIVDTDERISGDLTLCELKNVLASVPENVDHLSIRSNTGYIKPRFFRLPINGEFVGNIHEDWRSDGDHGLLNGMYFTELPKDFAIRPHHIRGLQEQILNDPRNARWHYYLGAAHEALGDYERALIGYNDVVRLSPKDSELALWASHRKSICRMAWKVSDKVNNYQGALNQLARSTDYPELFMDCARAADALEKWKDVAFWCNAAIQCGGIVNPGALRKRTMFLDLDDCFDGPFRLMKTALKGLGASDGLLEQQEAQIQNARLHRHKFITGT